MNTQGRYALSTALLKRTPAISNRDQLVFIVDSHAIEKDLMEVKADLLAHVRKELNNFHIQLELSVEIGGNDARCPTHLPRSSTNWRSETPCSTNCGSDWTLN
jgi:c-di-AMP phosphodiesterase-like protein